MQIDLVIPQDIHMPHFAFCCCKDITTNSDVGSKGLICLIRLQGPSEQDSRQEPGWEELKQNPQPTGLLPVVAQLAFLQSSGSPTQGWRSLQWVCTSYFNQQLRKCPKICTQANLMEVIPQLRVLLPRCVRLTPEADYNSVYLHLKSSDSWISSIESKLRAEHKGQDYKHHVSSSLERHSIKSVPT